MNAGAAQRCLLEAFAAMRAKQHSSLTEFAGAMADVIDLARAADQSEVAVLYEAIRDLALAVESDHALEAAR